MRSAVVGVVVVRAECRDLDLADVRVGRPHRDRPELVLVQGAREQLERPLGQRGGGEIPVLRPAPQQDVAQRATDDVRRVAPAHSVVQQVEDGVRDRGLEVGRHVARSGRQFLPRNR